MIKLPDVTFVMVETQSHELAKIATEDCLNKMEFGDAIVFTDKPAFFDGVKARVVTVPNWPSKVEWCRANWYLVPLHIETSHILFCQWDAGIWNPEDWTNDYLQYDYVGALWNWHPAKRVGNSGFSLKSYRLARFVYKNRDKYQCDVPVEDDLLCRKYRTDLEANGFEWAPEGLAHKFAYEGCGPNPRPMLESHFGFHGAFNFSRVFNNDQLETRAQLMLADDYIRNSYMMQSFALANPELSTITNYNPEAEARKSLERRE